jgi:hypothetical protein
VVVDAGNLFWKSATIPPGRLAEQQEKARLQVAALLAVGIDAVLPGEGELALGLDFVVGQELPWVASNLTCNGDAPFADRRDVERGGQHVTVLGVVGQDASIPGCRPSDPVPALRAAVAGPHDLVVVLSGQRSADDRAMMAAVPGVDVVVNGADRRTTEAAESLVGGGLLVDSGSRGRQLGALRLTRVPGAGGWADVGGIERARKEAEDASSRVRAMEERLSRATTDKDRERAARQLQFAKTREAQLRQKVQSDAGESRNRAENQLITMGADIPDHAATAALLEAAKVRIARLGPAADAAYEGPFVGSKACLGCHGDQAAQWQQTAHARAYASLVANHREFDQACFTCHVTGAQHPDGPTDPHHVEELENVGCEACHGAGRDHAAMPTNVHLERSPTTTTCIRCHDATQDGGRFDEASYRAQVRH